MAFTSGTDSGMAISNNFPLAGGTKYSVRALVKAPAGTPIKFVLRRGGPTYESLMPDQYVTGTGTWQTVSFSYPATHSAPNARFDIQVLSGKVTVNIREVHVQRAWPAEDVIGVFVDGAAIRRAHHPNFGRADADPDSPYGIIASAGGKTTVDTAGLHDLQMATLPRALACRYSRRLLLWRSARLPLYRELASPSIRRPCISLNPDLDIF